MLRGLATIVLGTAAMLVALFGVMFFLASQCFAPADPGTSTVRPTWTPAPSTEGGADARRGSSNDGIVDTPTAPATATAAPSATPPPPSPTPPLPAPTQAPQTQPPPAAQPPAAQVTATFSGNWRVVDVVTQGSGTGQTYTFDVFLTQNGAALSGGNGGITINGTVAGQSASATFSQPALGITGTFTWAMDGSGNASGTFSTSVPNSGTSQLVKR